MGKQKEEEGHYIIKNVDFTSLWPISHKIIIQMKYLQIAGIRFVTADFFTAALY